MDIKERIVICSGWAGLQAYETLSTKDFISWFEDNTQWNGPETKEIARSVIAELANR